MALTSNPGIIEKHCQQYHARHLSDRLHARALGITEAELPGVCGVREPTLPTVDTSFIEPPPQIISEEPVLVGMDWPKIGGLEPFGSVDLGFASATICPSGTACSGPSISLPGGFSGCLGTCKPVVGPDTTFDPGGSVGGTPGGTIPGSSGCDLPTQAFCQSTCGSNGAACRSAGACARGYQPRLEKNGRTGPCVKRRRMNPANAKASARAARRVTAAIKHQDKLVKAMKKTMRGR